MATQELTAAPAVPSLDRADLDGLVAYWNAANYLTVAQIYLRDNALLREPLAPSTSSRGYWATGGRRRG